MMPSNRNTTHYVTSLCYELCRDVEGRQGDSCIYVTAVHHEVMTVYTHTHNMKIHVITVVPHGANKNCGWAAFVFLSQVSDAGGDYGK